MSVKWLDSKIPNWGSIKSRYLCGDDVDVIANDEIGAFMYMFMI